MVVVLQVYEHDGAGDKTFKKSKGILTLSQQTALKLVENAAKGEYSGSERLVRHVFDREEGKPTEHVVLEEENVLTHEQCEHIREILRKNFEATAHNKS